MTGTELFNWIGSGLTVLAGLSFAWSYHLRQSESNATTTRILSHQEKSTDDIKANQKTVIGTAANDIKADQKTLADGITAGQDAAAEDIKLHVTKEMQGLLARLKREERTGHDELGKRYPFGYVLFGGQGGNMVHLPFYRGEMFVEADWAKTQLFLDTREKKFRLCIPSWTMKTASGEKPPLILNVPLGTWAPADLRYTVGQSYLVPLVVINGQPNIYFEIIDDNPKAPIYVLGFKL